MKLLNTALITGVLALAGCSSSNDTGNINTGPVADDPINGSIIVGTEPSPFLSPIPDVEFVGPTESGTGGGPEDRVETVFDDGAAESSTVALGGTDAGSADAGASDGGATDGGFASADVSGTELVAGSEGDSVSILPATDSAEPTSLPPHHDDQFRAGTLTAADYDDQLNPHLYQTYASDYLQRVGGRLDVPYLDLSNRIALHVKDNEGRPYGEVTLQFTDGNNEEILTLKTPASGTTYVYTDVDAIPEQFTLFATGLYGSSIEQTISLSDAKTSGAIYITVPETQTPPDATRPATVLDVMFVIDTTGSMGDELRYLQTELTPIINAIPYEQSLLNVGLTFYRDIGDEYVVRSHGFTNDIGRAQQTLNSESYDGGGDYPEAMDQALHQAIDANWTPNSKRIAFLIADAPPHGNKMRATWDAAEQARLKNIHIVPIAASGVGEDAEYLMRSMAAYTNSRYLFLTDDSGFGNPHAEPDVDCYVVTHLDNLMIRVLNSLINGQRDEPSDNDIIRRVGNYDRGVCSPAQVGQQQ